MISKSPIRPYLCVKQIKKKHMKRLISLLCLGFILVASLQVNAQVGINKDNSTPDSSAILDLKSTETGLLVPRMTITQRDLIANPATGLMVFQTNETPGFYYFNGTNWIPLADTLTPGHTTGELFGGGVVFWTDLTGEHGLIVGMVDLSASQAWSNITAIPIGAAARSDWNGPGNSTAIINQAGHTSSAAKLCLDYTNVDYGTGIFSDWYLPARAELNHIWNHFFEVQRALDVDGNPSTTKLATDNYWSSTEESDGSAWYFYFTSGGTSNVNKHNTQKVRAVRAF
jgi:hypothetical protein